MPRPVFDRPIAHRGLHDRKAGVIENTASAFEAAIAKGYAIECDLQLSKDGVPVVFHDDDLKRLIGRPEAIGAFSAVEIGRMPLIDSSAGDRPQRFSELLAQVNGRALLQVELKQQPTPAANEALARASAEAVRTYPGPLVFESFDPALISWVKRFGFEGARGIITYRYDEPDYDGHLKASERFILRHLLHWPWTRFDFISANEEALNLTAVRFWRAMGRPVTSWTVRSADSARKALTGGADQIVFEGFDPGD
jgi:glycerophosphoryl diester phosphodiesterase